MLIASTNRWFAVRVRGNVMPWAFFLAFPALMVLSVLDACAQEQDEQLVRGLPLENAIVNRPLALRLRTEVQVTDDDEDLIDEDPNYRRFPAEMYTGEITLFQRNRMNAGFLHSQWHNPQGFETARSAWQFQAPLAAASTLKMKYQHSQDDATDAKNAAYLALGHSFTKNLYSYTQYRSSAQGGGTSDHQLRQYMSWRCSSALRVGAQGALSDEPGAAPPYPWYVQTFASYFLSDRTSLRADVMNLEAINDFAYQEGRLFLYQMLGTKSLLQLNYRYYTDTEDFSSHAFGIKGKHFFSDRIAAHVGYRRYEHDTGAAMNTALAGLSVLL